MLRGTIGHTGTRVRAEIETRGDLATTTAQIESQMRSLPGDGPVTAMTAHVVVAQRAG